MRYVFATLAGLFFGGLIVGVAVALPRTTVKQSPAVSGMPMSATMGSPMMGTIASPATAKLTIQHVQRGCHVWSNGKTTAAMMRLHLRLGQRLSIIDMDVDAHQMMEFAGPMHLRMSGPMTMMNRTMTMSFPRKGVYRLGTKTVEMPRGMDVKTIGPDNTLRLVVTVA
jgi:hypothetical protein